MLPAHTQLHVTCTHIAPFHLHACDAGCYCRYFDSYQSLGEFMDLDLLDHLGDAMLLTEKLMFLCMYVCVCEVCEGVGE